MARTRTSTLTFDRGTLILHPPPKGRAWLDFVTWDDRIEKFRLPAMQYRAFLEMMKRDGIEVNDKAKGWSELNLELISEHAPYEHQQDALDAWLRAGRRGIAELPTGAGKTFVAYLAMQATPRSTLIVVPTLDLMHQWYAGLEVAFPETEIGLLGGGSKDESPILVATYDSAAIYAEKLGSRYGLLIFDECHHLPADFTRVIAEYSLAPYRLGLSATLERGDGKHEDLKTLVGPVVHSKTPQELSGHALAEHRIEQIKVELTDDERKRYDAYMELRNNFLQGRGIRLGTLEGWQRFVRESARSKEGRAAMLAHREARSIAFGTEGKLRVLLELLQRHEHDRVLVFTDDNAMVYKVSQTYLIPAITHQTKVKERHSTLVKFKEGVYPRIVTSRVLNEGVDVPEANVAIVMSGTGTTREYVQRLGRILRKGEGKLAVLYEVIAENTSEEGVSRRRRGEGQPLKKPTKAVMEHVPIQDSLSFEDL